MNKVCFIHIAHKLFFRSHQLSFRSVWSYAAPIQMLTFPPPRSWTRSSSLNNNSPIVNMLLLWHAWMVSPIDNLLQYVRIETTFIAAQMNTQHIIGEEVPIWGYRLSTIWGSIGNVGGDTVPLSEILAKDFGFFRYPERYLDILDERRSWKRNKVNKKL